MTLWSRDDAVAATGGRSSVDWAASGVSIDTRTLEPGDLFVALKDVRDGHDFVADALAKGASAALVSRLPEGVADDAPLLIVPDVLAGLEDLAKAARARTSAKVIAVTGSAGKTSTKEMLRSALTGQGLIRASEKSYNNHWGVPLTLARMPAETDFAIIEIGMNHPGEIAPLAKLAKPDVAIVTTVAPAHLEAFDDVRAIAEEKADIFKGLNGVSGISVFNADLEVSDVLAARAPGPARSFGRSDGAAWQLMDASLQGDTTVCEARSGDATILFKLSAPGLHFAMNGLAALAAIDAAGGDLGRAAVSLSLWQPPAGRGRRRSILCDAVDETARIDLFDDAYNANPASVVAALEVLAAASPPKDRGRRIAILGDMKELGPTEAARHAEIAKLPAMEQIHLVHTVGPLMRHLHDAIAPEQRGTWAETSAELATDLRHLLQAGDVVMVKGSLSMKMALIVDAITNLGQAVDKKDEGTP